MTLVRYESAGHVATITMDRASAHNALNNALCADLREAWLRFRDSDDRVAVLASSEEAYFSVGADVRDFPVGHVARGAWIGRRAGQAGHCSDIRLGRRRWLRAGADGRHVRCLRDDALQLSRSARSAPPAVASHRCWRGCRTRSPWNSFWSARKCRRSAPTRSALSTRSRRRDSMSCWPRRWPAKIAAAAPLVVQALKKLARDAMPKGPLETVAEVRRLLDADARKRRPQGRRQGVQRKAQAAV